MQYRTLKHTGENVSVLGLGCMRFPTIDGGEKINETEAIKMIRFAIDNGVNYIDTAWPYHGGQSESVVGKALQDGYRDKVMLATKCPVFSLNRPEDFEEIFEKQLEKLQTDHIDFYLMHSLSENTWNNVVLKFGLLEKAVREKEAGRIRHIGFSFHDTFQVFQQIIHGFNQWEFCQIQLNYADINNQAGIQGLRYAAEQGLDVIIMEPLRGGRLAIPPARVADRLAPQKTPVEWGLDFLWNQKEVGVVLSGMSSMTQLMENIGYADCAKVDMLTAEEKEMLVQAGEIFNHGALVGCTGCGYCLPCPVGIEIPEIFRLYNQTASGNAKQAKEQYEQLSCKADQCRKCRQCEKNCPQHIEIHSVMEQAAVCFAK
ncbi:aldo/keto reductase [Ructibacterium gallinarum]|uniref:Aldo/keto reductase n=1 Tax=Ructibacterium gallinarum TaxID=2779355 RepID=A0A9D5LYR8_9FIRM|nr:aldo/keto reductase [Ructibacterium gallinarum]MBE5040488.1 aldo/keto reductase [Ructibacterium gallinarum]